MLVLATWKREGSDRGRNWKEKKKRKERKLNEFLIEKNIGVEQ